MEDSDFVIEGDIGPIYVGEIPFEGTDAPFAKHWVAHQLPMDDGAGSDIPALEVRNYLPDRHFGAGKTLTTPPETVDNQSWAFRFFINITDPRNGRQLPADDEIAVKVHISINGVNRGFISHKRRAFKDTDKILLVGSSSIGREIVSVGLEGTKHASFTIFFVRYENRPKSDSDG